MRLKVTFLDSWRVASSMANYPLTIHASACHMTRRHAQIWTTAQDSQCASTFVVLWETKNVSYFMPIFFKMFLFAAFSPSNLTSYEHSISSELLSVLLTQSQETLIKVAGWAWPGSLSITETHIPVLTGLYQLVSISYTTAEALSAARIMMFWICSSRMVQI